MLNIEFSRKDKSNFLFPQKYTIGDDVHDTDLMIVLQRREKNRKYVTFYCNQSAPGAPAQGNPITYEQHERLLIIDSLKGLFCIEKGNYRLKVGYNKRRADGQIEAPNIILSSNWIKFSVTSDRIITNPYLLERLKEINKN